MRKQEDIDKVIEMNSFYDLSEYDFSLGYDEKSKVICPKHGVLYRRFRDLKRGLTCVECNKENYVSPNAETTESYISKVNKKFPNHSINWEGFEYPKMQHNLITLNCKKHGEFETTPNRALNLRVDPCPKCSAEIRGVSLVGDKESFIKKAKEKYGDKYSYDKVSFKRLADDVEIYCNIHKEYFTINASNFIHNAKIGCPKCILDMIKETQRIPQDEFIRRCKEAHGESFDLSKVKYDGGTRKIEVKCNTCGNTFFPIADNFSSGSGCPFCAELNKQYKWKDEPTRLYILELDNNLYKVGITTKTVKQRYCKDLESSKYKILYEELFSEGREPFRIEQKLRHLMWEYHYEGESPFKHTGTNEVFTINPLRYVDKAKELVKQNQLSKT